MTLRLRAERKRRDWTLAYVGEKVGVCGQTILDIEKGRAKPSYDVLRRLEDLFRMGHRELLSAERREQVGGHTEYACCNERDGQDNS